MPRVPCQECDRDVAVHELDANTVTQRDGFETTYRCPYCRAEIEDVDELLSA